MNYITCFPSKITDSFNVFVRLTQWFFISVSCSCCLCWGVHWRWPQQMWYNTHYGTYEILLKMFSCTDALPWPYIDHGKHNIYVFEGRCRLHVGLVNYTIAFANHKRMGVELMRNYYTYFILANSNLRPDANSNIDYIDIDWLSMPL